MDAGLQDGFLDSALPSCFHIDFSLMRESSEARWVECLLATSAAHNASSLWPCARPSLMQNDCHSDSATETEHPDLNDSL